MASDESWERALADVEILESAFPDEVRAAGGGSSFPLAFTLNLPGDARITMSLAEGYPHETGVLIDSYRSKPADKSRMEATVSAVRRVSEECLQDEMEGCLMCCSTAMEAWESNESALEADQNSSDELEENVAPSKMKSDRIYEWITGEPLMDRKSTFQAHICRVTSEREVYGALDQLLTGNSKLQRASHNMLAWRVSEVIPPSDPADEPIIVRKHDNDDDGEDMAGSKLAYLLELRKDDNVLVVVSRWFGGIQLGPKRFAHIVNVARELLVSTMDDEPTASASNGKGRAIDNANPNRRQKR